jgi:hypothetical protein
MNPKILKNLEISIIFLNKYNRNLLIFCYFFIHSGDANSLYQSILKFGNVRKSRNIFKISRFCNLEII